MPEDNFISKRNVYAPFFRYYRFKLLFFSFGPWSRFSLFCLYFLRVHLIIDLKRAGWEHFKKRLAIVADIEGLAEGGIISYIVDLKIEIGVSVPK
jgi:hypothetical protein